MRWCAIFLFISYRSFIKRFKVEFGKDNIYLKAMNFYPVILHFFLSLSFPVLNVHLLLGSPNAQMADIPSLRLPEKLVFQPLLQPGALGSRVQMFAQNVRQNLMEVFSETRIILVGDTMEKKGNGIPFSHATLPQTFKQQCTKHTQKKR